MELIGINQYGVTIYKIEDGLFHCTYQVSNESYIEATIKTDKPESITLNVLMRKENESRKSYR